MNAQIKALRMFGQGTHRLRPFRNSYTFDLYRRKNFGEKETDWDARNLLR